MSSYWARLGLNPTINTSILRGRGNADTKIHGGRCVKIQGEDSQGEDSQLQAKEGPKTKPTPVQHLDLGLLASRIEKINSCCLSHPNL